MADDYHVEAGGVGYREAVMTFFVLCQVSGVPLSWQKTAGADTIARAGFETLHHNYSLGITERRAERFARWAEEVAAAGHINTHSFEEGLGRITYAAGALEYDRPFVAPLYRFLTPSYVSLILRYLFVADQATRHYRCGSVLLPAETAPRVDAQASADRAGIGDWYPVKGKCGKINTRLSAWFSLEFRTEEWPWVYERGDKTALLMSTLEALAILKALNLFYDHSDGEKAEERYSWHRHGLTTGGTVLYLTN